MFHPLTPWSSRTLPVPVRFEARGFDGTGVPKKSDEKRVIHVIRIRDSKKDVGSSWMWCFGVIVCTPKSPLTWKNHHLRSDFLEGIHHVSHLGMIKSLPVPGCFNTREFRFTLDLRKDDVAWNHTLIYHGLSPFGI